MKIIKKEYHTVVSEFTYELDDDEIIEQFESVENFKALLDEDDWDVIDFINQSDYERYDDWVTDRKGGYEVTYEIEDE
jgi:succinate dehydrogenase flavin-adding protein (antitoxin of CptAB toxin-antitoxin module)